MDQKPIQVDQGTVEYYLNRLIQRAIAEPKPLLKIYEEECQRHSDISITITFKEFQIALQKHCMKMQSRNQQMPALDAKYLELNRYLKQQTSTFTSLGDMVDQTGRRRKTDTSQTHLYHRMQNPSERFSPQATNNIHRNNQRFPVAHNIKTEASTSLRPQQYSSPPALGMPPPSATVNRPPSIQPPLEEEPPPEFIEMSSHPPRLSSEAQFSGLGMFPGPSSGPTALGVICKTEPKDSDKSNCAVAVQSSSSLDKSISVLNGESISPLNVRCVKCITALVTCAVMPCGHCCLCSICGQTVLSLKQVCPVCRKSITTVIGYSNLIYNVYR